MKELCVLRRRLIWIAQDEAPCWIEASFFFAMQRDFRVGLVGLNDAR